MNEEEFLKAVTDLVADTIDAELAVKEEQLAEMREAAQELCDSIEHIGKVDERVLVHVRELGNTAGLLHSRHSHPLKKLRQALSAAPRRGRIPVPHIGETLCDGPVGDPGGFALAELNEEESTVRKREGLSWQGGAVVRDGHLWLDDELWQELQRIVDELPDGGTVTVTVREAE